MSLLRLYFLKDVREFVFVLYPELFLHGLHARVHLSHYVPFLPVHFLLLQAVLLFSFHLNSLLLVVFFGLILLLHVLELPVHFLGPHECFVQV